MPFSFPFSRLPILVQLLVLKHLDILELFYVSLISKRSKQIVKSLNLTLSKLCWDLWYRHKCTIKLTAPNRTGLDSCFPTSDIIMTRSEQMNVNGIIVPVPVTREPEGSWVCLDIKTTSVEESWELMDKFTEYFLELFKVSKYEVRLPVVPNFRSWFMWKYTKHFETVEVMNCRDDDGTRPSRQLTSDDVKFVLEELTIDDELDMRERVKEGVRYSGPLKMKKLHVFNEDLLTLETILNMDCEQLWFRFTSITYQDLNAIIKKWLTGGLRNLKDIEVIYFNRDPDMSKDAKRDHILGGIETFPWDIKNRPRKIRDFQCQNGRDFRRSDGTIATVDIVTYDWNDIFIFHIWHPSTATQ